MVGGGRVVAKVEAGRGVAIAGLVSSWRHAIVAQCDGRMSDVVVNGWVVGRRTAVAAQACGVQKKAWSMVVHGIITCTTTTAMGWDC